MKHVSRVSGRFGRLLLRSIHTKSILVDPSRGRNQRPYSSVGTGRRVLRLRKRCRVAGLDPLRSTVHTNLQSFHRTLDLQSYLRFEGETGVGASQSGPVIPNRFGGSLEV